jgi:hypothetical protein
MPPSRRTASAASRVAMQRSPVPSKWNPVSVACSSRPNAAAAASTGQRGARPPAGEQVGLRPGQAEPSRRPPRHHREQRVGPGGRQDLRVVAPSGVHRQPRRRPPLREPVEMPGRTGHRRHHLRRRKLSRDMQHGPSAGAERRARVCACSEPHLNLRRVAAIPKPR